MKLRIGEMHGNGSVLLRDACDPNVKMGGIVAKAYGWDAANEIVNAVNQHDAATRVQSVDLPKVRGVGRDAESPGQCGVLVCFERQLTDDELRQFHLSISGFKP